MYNKLMIIFLIIQSVLCFSASDTVSVRLDSVKTDKIEINDSAAVIFPDTAKEIKTDQPFVICVSKDTLTFVCGDRFYAAKSIMVCGEKNTVRFVSGDKKYRYKGSLLLAFSKGNISITDILSLEDYTKSVLSNEFPLNAPFESMKAMAVAVRTYAYAKSRKQNYHLCDTTHCQVYGNDRLFPFSEKAADDTRGEVLFYGNTPLSVMYSSDCGGVTADWKEMNGNDDFPYLSSVRCDCVHKKWDYNISLSEIEKKIRFENTEKILLEKSQSGRVLNIVFENAGGKKAVRGDKFRNCLGTGNIKSLLFDFEIYGERVAFFGSGYGHGYGLCQAGCIAMGSEGKNYSDILKYYYRGCDIKKVY